MQENIIQPKEENTNTELEPPGKDVIIENLRSPVPPELIIEIPTLNKLNKKGIIVKVESDLDACKEIFEAYSPKNNLFDTWGFRYAFFIGYKNLPIFITFEKLNEVIGVLPLWFEAEKKELRWFGSWWQEGNTFWFKDLKCLKSVLGKFNYKVLLNALQVDSKVAKMFKLEKDDPKYQLNLEEYPTQESFLQRFTAKKRYNLKRDAKIILSKNPRTVYNRFTDMERMFDLSIRRFESRDGSPFEKEARKGAFREILKQAGEYEVRMLSTEIDNEIVGVDLVAVYKNTCYALQGAYDLEKHPGLGNYSNLLIMDDARKVGAKIIDFLEVSYDWKESWFDPIKLYQYRQGPNGREFE
ncbi:MAG: GNAT family N-acetyltransferase [bacterium]